MRASGPTKKRSIVAPSSVWPSASHLSLSPLAFGHLPLIRGVGPRGGRLLGGSAPSSGPFGATSPPRGKALLGSPPYPPRGKTWEDGRPSVPPLREKRRNAIYKIIKPQIPATLNTNGGMNDADQIHFCHRRRGIRPGQGHCGGLSGPSAEAAGAAGEGPEAGPLPERGPGHHEPLSARGGVRHRRRGGDRPGPGPLRAVH